MNLISRNHVFEVSDQKRLKPVCSATETSYNIETLCVASYYNTFLGLLANNKDTDQTARMLRLVYAFVVRAQQSQVFSLWDTYSHIMEKIIISCHKIGIYLTEPSHQGDRHFSFK